MELLLELAKLMLPPPPALYNPELAISAGHPAHTNSFQPIAHYLKYSGIAEQLVEQSKSNKLCSLSCLSILNIIRQNSFPLQYVHDSFNT